MCYRVYCLYLSFLLMVCVEAFGADRLIVQYRDQTAMSGMLFAQSQVVEEKDLNALNIQILTLSSAHNTSQFLATLQQRPEVLAVEKDRLLYAQQVTPNDPEYSKQWYLPKIKMPSAWTLSTGTRSTPIVVAIIDSGIDYNHEDLHGNMWRNTSETVGNGVDDDGNGYVDDIYGINTRSETGNPMDDNTSHGTLVAGVIGATGNNGKGIAGMNWKIELMALKFMQDRTGNVSDAIEAIDYVLNMKNRGVNIRIVNASFGMSGSHSQLLHSAVNRLLSKDILFVAAAGNAGKDNDIEPIYPASFDSTHILSVAASGKADEKASFSHYGRLSVDLAAPGVDIWSTKAGGDKDQYTSNGGTSFATPQVSALAALIWSLNPALSAERVKCLIMQSVDPVSAWSNNTVTGGRINAFKTLNNMNQLCLPGIAAFARDSQVQLTWERISSATKYYIDREQIALIAFSQGMLNIANTQTRIAETTGLSYTDHTVENGLRYEYQIKAANAADEIISTKTIVVSVQKTAVSSDSPPSSGGGGCVLRAQHPSSASSTDLFWPLLLCYLMGYFLYFRKRR